MSINRPAVRRSPDPRSPHLVRRRPGRILIGLLAMTAGTAALIPAISSAGAPHGTHKLVFKIDGRARQNVVGAGGIVVTAECPAEACTVVASAKGESLPVSTGNERARVTAGGSARIMLPFSAKDEAKLQAALAAGKKPALTVTAMARDGYGAKVPLELTVTALRG
ncbi:MAG: hypothetical protein JWO14_140 [Solirubrobacterales bacterium]|nr:hypothetical protein [Solirubrobacterales bacterium]